MADSKTIVNLILSFASPFICYFLLPADFCPNPDLVNAVSNHSHRSNHHISLTNVKFFLTNCIH